MPQSSDSSYESRATLRHVHARHRGVIHTIVSVVFIVGGFLDAYSYLACAHVFANAQTGNLVLFGVRTAAGNWTSAWATLPPMLACICGVATHASPGSALKSAPSALP